MRTKVLAEGNCATVRLGGKEAGVQSHGAVKQVHGYIREGYRDRLDQSPAGLTILDFVTDVRARLQLFNHVSHDEGVPARIYRKRLSR